MRKKFGERERESVKWECGRERRERESDPTDEIDMDQGQVWRFDYSASQHSMRISLNGEVLGMLPRSLLSSINPSSVSPAVSLYSANDRSLSISLSLFFNFSLSFSNSLFLCLYSLFLRPPPELMLVFVFV